MLETWKDEKAAICEFENILGKGVAKEEQTKFLKGFLRSYKQVRNFFLSLEKKPTYRQVFGGSSHQWEYAFATDIGRYLEGAEYDLHQYLLEKERYGKGNIIRLGRVLGQSLAIIEYGLTSHSLNLSSKNSSIFRSVKDKALTEFKKIAANLKRLNLSVRHEFIENRIIKIGKSKGQELSDEQRELIAEIARLFV